MGVWLFLLSLPRQWVSKLFSPCDLICLGLVPSQETSACHGHNQKKEKSICIPILVSYYMHHVFIFAPHSSFFCYFKREGFFYEFRLDQCYIFYNFLLLLFFSVSPCTSKIHGLLLRFYNLFKFLES